MAGFEPGSSGVGSYYSANCATTTAQQTNVLFMAHPRTLFVNFLSFQRNSTIFTKVYCEICPSVIGFEPTTSSINTGPKHYFNELSPASFIFLSYSSDNHTYVY